MNIQSKILLPERLALPDLLRGFALLGILVVNLTFLAHGLDPVPASLEATPWDRLASWIVSFAFESKFYLLFSFLFGYGLSLQLARAEHQDTTLGPRYARRLLGLALFGVWHATCFFMGDILVSYALLGTVLWALRKRSVLSLVRFSLGMLVLAVLGRVVLAMLLSNATGTLLSSVPSTEPGYRGTFTDAIQQRLKDLIVFYVFTPLFNWPSALGLFALGLAAGKEQLLEKTERLKRLLRCTLPLLLLLGIGGNALYASRPEHFASLVLEALAAPALSALYLLGVLVLRHRLAWLAPAGQMSLTNYLGQAMIASFVFCGWGLGQFGLWGASQLLLFAPLLWGAQLLLSKLWLQRFRQGPDEWLLRCLTYARWEPLRKER
ncbi:DUF418 domain-containing protein [Armatimonas sp.]|uniref:DUF418 domain-containing protein n=1 Tax=Armatimonas sp. TaxID=1872638 RepID=UPI00286B82F2|nr:DUF418 domain-containing protein [Armatimonas sp.]